ncbi:MAG: Asp-tRNA(Asn)/Glu-tRNA(Gln) amidotransferase subunit GatC [Patescibacteria group bacterium]|nr:Asp-tRNA(Asn)/Glu-tRNA(Gln) amidotransferase subunit GatC [Patescibacteria group bacterium]
MNNKITKEEIEHLADLSRLELTDAEKTKMAKDAVEILALVDDLQKAGVEKEQPFLFEDQVNITREDNNPQDCNEEEFLKQAPDRERQFFKVPRIL